MAKKVLSNVDDVCAAIRARVPKAGITLSELGTSLKKGKFNYEGTLTKFVRDHVKDMQVSGDCVGPKSATADVSVTNVGSAGASRAVLHEDIVLAETKFNGSTVIFRNTDRLLDSIRGSGFAVDLDEQSVFFGRFHSGYRNGFGVECLSSIERSAYVGAWADDYREGSGYVTVADIGLGQYREYEAGCLSLAKDVEPGLFTIRWNVCVRRVCTAAGVDTKLSRFYSIDGVFLHSLKPQSHESHCAAIDQVAAMVKAHPRWRVAEIVKAGSFGKGTMFASSADVDVVMLLVDFDITQYSQYVKDGAELFKSFGATTTPYAIQFCVDGIDVDVLFGQKDFSTIPTQHIEHARLYSASYAKKQVAFFQTLPVEFQDLVRLLKFWRSIWIWVGQTWPKSYLLELMALNVFFSQKNASVSNMFRYCLQLFAKPSMMVAPAKPYLNGSEHCVQHIPAHIKSQRPFVMDIMNPANNVADGFKPDLLRLYAEMTLAFLDVKTV